MKIASGMMLAFLFIGMLTLAFNIPLVKASGTIYIRADGRVEPPTASILRIGDVYTFTANMCDSIVVEKDNIVIEGNGYALLGNGYNLGIILAERNNVTVHNVMIKGFAFGIGVWSSSRNTLIGNRIEDTTSGAGIVISDSEYNKILNNILSRNDHSITLGGSCNNLIDGNNACYNHEGISMGGSWNNIIANNVANYNSGDGILLSGCFNNVVTNNVADYNGHGGVILDGGSSENVISDNMFAGNTYGIKMHDYSHNNLVVSNTLSSNFAGVSIDSGCNIITGNNAVNNEIGIKVGISSSHNIISENNIRNNGHGIGISDSSSNTIYHNNFVNNIYEQANAWDSTNVWDDGYPSGGNYWSDYNGVDTDGDGIGNTPYIIDDYNQDNFPLMEPWSAPTMIKSLIRAVVFWDLPRGTENSLTSKLEDALHLLGSGNENGAIRKLMDFMSQIEALRGRKLNDEQANYLISEAQRIIDLIDE